MENLHYVRDYGRVVRKEVGETLLFCQCFRPNPNLHWQAFLKKTLFFFCVKNGVSKESKKKQKKELCFCITQWSRSETYCIYRALLIVHIEWMALFLFLPLGDQFTNIGAGVCIRFLLLLGFLWDSNPFRQNCQWIRPNPTRYALISQNCDFIRP